MIAQPCRARGWLAPGLGTALVLWLAPASWGQFVLPYQTLESLRVELHSLRDEVTLYAGNPQQLLELHTRPEGVYPHILLTPGLDPTLRIRDRALVDAPSVSDSAFAQEEGWYAPAQLVATPKAEKWQVMLSPPGPTQFLLRCERGTGNFDFSDLPVREVQLIGVDAALQVEFRRRNSILLERCRLVADGGSLEVRQLLNARPHVVTVQIPRAVCDVQITGKPFEGESSVYFEGVPEKLHLTLSRQAGVHIEGPTELLAMLEGEHLQRDGQAIASRDFASAPCKVRLHFKDPVPAVNLEWD